MQRVNNARPTNEHQMALIHSQEASPNIFGAQSSLDDAGFDPSFFEDAVELTEQDLSPLLKDDNSSYDFSILV